jgi:hypothetical protein
VEGLSGAVEADNARLANTPAAFPAMYTKDTGLDSNLFATVARRAAGAFSDHEQR